MSPNRLYRSNTNKVFAGVAGGLAEFLGTDPVLIRVLFVLAAIFGGGGLLIYIILWIAVPEKPFYYPNMEEPKKESDQGNPPRGEPFKKKNSEGLIAGLILIAVGILFLIHRLVPHIGFKDLWPIALIIIGIILLAGAFTGKSEN